MLTEEQRQVFRHEVADSAMMPTPVDIEAQLKKDQRLQAEREWIESQARENRERLAEEKQKIAEQDFKKRCESVFFAVNPNAEGKDFLRLYDKIRDRVLMDTCVDRLLSKSEYSYADEMR